MYTGINSIETKTKIFIDHGHISEKYDWDTTCKRCGVEIDEGYGICPQAETIHMSTHRKEIARLMNNFGGVKSGKKITKKINQIYGKSLRELTEKQVDDRLKNFNENLIKPKPKYIPRKVWNWLKAIILEEKIKI